MRCNECGKRLPAHRLDCGKRWNPKGEHPWMEPAGVRRQDSGTLGRAGSRVAMSVESDSRPTGSTAERDGTPKGSTPGWSPQEDAVQNRGLFGEEEAEVRRLTDALWEDHGWQYFETRDGTDPWIDYVDPNTGERYSIDV